MKPENTIKKKKVQKRQESKALEHLVEQIRSNPDATTAQKQMASALIALKES